MSSSDGIDNLLKACEEYRKKLDAANLLIASQQTALATLRAELGALAKASRAVIPFDVTKETLSVMRTHHIPLSVLMPVEHYDAVAAACQAHAR